MPGVPIADTAAPAIGTPGNATACGPALPAPSAQPSANGDAANDTT